MAKKEVAIPSPSDVPSVYDFGDDESGGFGGQTMDFIKRPILEIVQRGTPSDKIPDGAEIGDIYNTVTGEFFPNKTGVLFVPAAAQHKYTEWVPREAGGGFKGQHDVISPDVIKAKNAAPGQLRLSITRKGPAGEVRHDLVETFYLWGAVVTEEGDVLYPAMIPFVSTKIDTFTTWNSRVRIFLVPGAGRKVNPPMWAHLLRITTKHATKDKYEWETFVLGHAFGNMKNSLLQPSDPRYIAGRELATLIEAGQVQADFSGVTSDAAGSTSGDSPPPF